MKYRITPLLFVLTALLFNSEYRAQDSSRYMMEVQTLDATIQALYSVISGEKGEARNWEFMKFLFHPDAKLIPTGKTKDGSYKAKFITPQDYIDRSGPWLIENGFFEKEIHRETDSFGHITQVFSTYETFHSESDEAPFMRGINSIQLINDGSRWWILNIYWSQESEEEPIPARYLPD